MPDIRVRVGQENAIKVIASVASGGHTLSADNVVGGIASVTQLSVSGISSLNGDVFVSGISSFSGDVFVNGNFFATEINGGTY
jgi:hypothetical protein